MRRLAHIVLLWLAALSGVWADPVPEYHMKATYLYNFALYTEWPETVDNIRLCILGEHHFGDALQAINGKALSERRLEVRQVAAQDSLAECQMVFLGEREARTSRKILERISNLPVLTVTEGPLPLYSGIMVSMVVENNRLGFYINASAARHAGLNVSSKLLKLARRVY